MRGRIFFETGHQRHAGVLGTCNGCPFVGFVDTEATAGMTGDIDTIRVQPRLWRVWKRRQGGQIDKTDKGQRPAM